ncbi:nucleotidyltransferase family protein [Ottowia testudinis]|uniref:Nucleotidyltransferase family protein n=1 Tax=Ottowia testudinis TaxID=2816950 RepID=A0A975CFQ1_9BURK|nr:nucleotidyltransferase family protein [Ottowia testudinis]QTD45593.1 nucleotidyltransferase family protein [Ottowia testudinis]
MPTAPVALDARALILAAGRGERMRPLTDTCPKPLLPVRGQPLLQWWVDALARGGVRDIVVNTAWLGEQIEGHFAVQSASDKRGQLPNQEYHAPKFSPEGRDFGYALETAGGIARALPLLAPQPGDVFWVVAGDVFAPDFTCAPDAVQRFIDSGRLAHLWLVPNPAHKPDGDFGIGPHGMALNGAPPGGPRHTFSTIALYRRALFEPPWCDILPGNPQGTAAPLAPLLRKAIDAGQVSAELYTGAWTDVGTPQRLAALNAPSSDG